MSAISGGSTASFQYDPLGRRVLRTINSATTQFLYDGLNPVQELDGSSPPNVTANLLTGRGIDEYFVRTDPTGAHDFLADMLGSTIALADSSGALQTQYSYDPFGNATVSGASSSNPYQFAGRENDGAGFYFYRARFYQPLFQRFPSQDPLGLMRRNANLYSYVLNAPVDLRDPLGLFCQPGSNDGSGIGRDVGYFMGGVAIWGGPIYGVPVPIWTYPLWGLVGGLIGGELEHEFCDPPPFPDWPDPPILPNYPGIFPPDHRPLNPWSPPSACR